MADQFSSRSLVGYAKQIAHRLADHLNEGQEVGRKVIPFEELLLAVAKKLVLTQFTNSVLFIEMALDKVKSM